MKFEWDEIKYDNNYDMKTTSRTNWERLRTMSDDEIDCSDIPPLTEEFFTRATWQTPTEPIEVRLQLEPKLLAWFQLQGEDYQERMIAALRIYALAHKDTSPTARRAA